MLRAGHTGDVTIERRSLVLDGVRLSYLRAGDESSPPALLLHGTFWSRVWQPVLPTLGTSANVVALDFPGFGRSDGELEVASASVPALADLAGRVVDALGWERYSVVGHDIGGGMAQHLAVNDARVQRLALVNGVLLDSWPVPAVARFADPDVRARTGPDDLLASRRESMTKAVGRTLTDAEIEDYLSPWHSPARTRSWMAMAAAADSRYTRDLVDGLVARALPTLLVWGEDDAFQRIEYAERFVARVPSARLERLPGRHIPMEDEPQRVGELLAAFVGGP